MNIAVLGGGAWGSVLAGLLADNGHDVALWEFDPAAAAQLATQRTSVRGPADHRLPPSVAVTPDLLQAVRGRALVVLAVPSETIRTTLTNARAALGNDALVTCVSKGLEPGTFLTMDRVIQQVQPGAPVVLLSGPTFAQEIARGLPAAVVAASEDARAAETVQDCFAQYRLRVYTSDDVTGVAIGGALKNVIAIAVGCSDGFGFGNNARAALITRGRASADAGRVDRPRRSGADLHRRAVAQPPGRAGPGPRRGATRRPEASRSRRRRHRHRWHRPRAGRRRLGIDMPITRLTAEVLHDGKPPRAAVTELLSRTSRPERE
jgi:glycerol-3-phosphate dehydrogenase (NAD(P)+)